MDVSRYRKVAQMAVKGLPLLLLIICSFMFFKGRCCRLRRVKGLPLAGLEKLKGETEFPASDGNDDLVEKLSDLPEYYCLFDDKTKEIAAYLNNFSYNIILHKNIHSRINSFYQFEDIPPWI